jgi:hypothetical protein
MSRRRSLFRLTAALWVLACAICSATYGEDQAPARRMRYESGAEGAQLANQGSSRALRYSIWTTLSKARKRFRLIPNSSLPKDGTLTPPTRLRFPRPPTDG